jgi:hypothetical protein
VDAFKLIAELETHVLNTTGGWENERALVEFRRLTRNLIRVLDGPEWCHRLEFACDLAEIFYNTRQHRRWDRGAAQLHNAILAEIESLRHALSAG